MGCLLQREGVLNSLLLSLGLIDEPVRMIFNRFAVYVAMVTCSCRSWCCRCTR
jgi:ABC-type spermidine/putrescine transport system permease subunit I